MLRYSARINGLTELAITKMDVLSGLSQIKLCVAYRQDGKTYEELPLGPSHLAGCEAVYEEVKGWSEDVSSARKINDLPQAAREYLNRIEALIGLPIKMISVGPEREQIVIRD